MRRTVAALVALVLLAPLGLRAAWSLPVQAVAVLSAVDCCAKDCDHAARPPSAAGRCCGVEEGEPAVASTLASVAFGTVPSAALPRPAPVGEARAGRTAVSAPLPDRPPLFLVHRSLLI